MTAQFLTIGLNGHVAKMDDRETGAIQGALAEMMLFAESRTDSKGRTLWNLPHVAGERLKAHHERIDSQLREKAQVHGRRSDNFSGGLGMFNVRDLTHKIKRVLEERMPELTSEQVLPVNTEVPPGALKYEQYRGYSAGEAVVYRGGDGQSVPSVSIGQASFTQRVQYMITKIEVNWLEQLRSDMVGVDTQTRKMRAARRVLGELDNKWSWNGFEAGGLYGILNHPYVDTIFTTVAFTASYTAEQISRAMSSWANYAAEQSGGTFQPDTLAIAIPLYNYMANERFGSSNGDTVLDQFKRAHPHIKRIVIARELNAAGPGGQHGIVFLRSGSGPSDSSMEKMLVMPTTVLTPDVGSLKSTYYLVRATGGVNQTEVGDNLIVWVPLS